MMGALTQSSPARGGGPRAKRVVEGALRLAQRLRPPPSTILRMVPLLVPGWMK